MPPESVDLEAAGLGHLAGRVRAATLAPNWKTVLAADASLGVVGIVVGVLIAALWIVWLGVVIAGLGVFYLLAVGRRFLQWRWIRRQVGLD